MERISSVKEYFDTLPRRFVASASKGVSAVYQFDLSGEGGAQYRVAVTEGLIDIAEGQHEAPTVTFKMTAQDYIKLTNGELDGRKAFMMGRMKIAGNMALAMKMQELFPPSKS